MFARSQVVEFGGTAVDTTVSSGGILTILSGALSDPAIISSGGIEVVSAGGTDLGALISGGEQGVFGYASGATVLTGSQVVESGGTASSTTVSSGGTLDVLSGGTAIAPHLLAGGTFVIGGTLSGFPSASASLLKSQAARRAKPQC